MDAAGVVAGSEEGNRVQHVESLRVQSTVCSCTKKWPVSKTQDGVGSIALSILCLYFFVFLYFSTLGFMTGVSHSGMGQSDMVFFRV